MALFAVLYFPLKGVAKGEDLNSSIDKLRKKRETLSREIQRNKAAAKKKKAEVFEISSELKKIDGDISITESRIAQTKESIDAAQKDIDKLTGDIVAKETELSVEKERQKEAIRVLYETTYQDQDLMLFNQSISEAIERSSYLEALEVRIDSTISSIKKIKEELALRKAGLVKKQEELKQLKQQQEAYKKGLAYQKSEKQNLLVSAKLAQSEYEKRVEEARAAYRDVNSELYRLTQAARRKAARGGVKKIGNKTFAWPFSGPLTTGFGEATPIQSFHTGYDIDGVIGDPIYAAADGEVTFVGGNQNYGYGLYIVIDHGSGVTTLYGHLSGFNVKQGDEVTLGQKIGFMGNTGFAIAFAGGDGSHLHFEVREDGVPVDPGLYLP